MSVNFKLGLARFGAFDNFSYSSLDSSDTFKPVEESGKYENSFKNLDSVYVNKCGSALKVNFDIIKIRTQTLDLRISRCAFPINTL